MPIPPIEALRKYFPALVEMVAKTSWLPNATTVSRVGTAVFPACRYKTSRPRFSHIEENDVVLGMYDDNATPEWTIFWAHGLQGTRPQGWTIAHVWPASDDINAYTHLANLAMVPEPFASLTDKNGPLTVFLRWHSWEVYGWKPERETEPTKPDGYDEVKWRYLEGVENPTALICQRFNELNNRRVRILRPIMESRKMLWAGNGKMFPEHP